jgi:hypothetical protein
MKNYTEIVNDLGGYHISVNVINSNVKNIVYDTVTTNVWRNVRNNVLNNIRNNIRNNHNLFKYNSLQQYKDNI